MENMIDELRELQRKAALYDKNKQRYTDYTVTLKGIIDELQSILKDLDPVIVTKDRVARGKTDEVTKKFYDLLVAGTHVHTELIQFAHPELKYSDVQNVMTRLKTMPGIEKRKEGAKVFLFHREA